MWARYRKTFWGMQAVIAAVCVSTVLATHHLAVGAVFFLTMQFGSVSGVVWAERLSKMLASRDVGARRIGSPSWKRG
jgi:hypothetical protein